MIRLRYGASPYRRYLSAAHADQYEIPVKNTTYVLKTTTYREGSVKSYAQIRLQTLAE